MAIWQFNFYLVPQDKAEFSKNGLSAASLALIKQKFPLGKSWSKNLTVLGNLDETCLSFWGNIEKCDEIECRLDLRALKKEDATAILDFASENGLVIELENERLKPTLESLKSHILSSPAYRVVKNPEDYLNILT